MSPEFSKKKSKIAFITGVTDQDGSYLADFLFEKSDIVHRLKARLSSFNKSRIDNIYKDNYIPENRFKFHHQYLNQISKLIRVIEKIQSDQLYNFVAQINLSIGFYLAEYSTNINALGTFRFLEAVRILVLSEKTKFYQAYTSELYGISFNSPQKEDTVSQYRKESNEGTLRL